MEATLGLLSASVWSRGAHYRCPEHGAVCVTGQAEVWCIASSLKGSFPPFAVRPFPLRVPVLCIVSEAQAPAPFPKSPVGTAALTVLPLFWAAHSRSPWVRPAANPC